MTREAFNKLKEGDVVVRKCGAVLVMERKRIPPQEYPGILFVVLVDSNHTKYKTGKGWSVSTSYCGRINLLESNTQKMEDMIWQG